MLPESLVYQVLDLGEEIRFFFFFFLVVGNKAGRLAYE